MVRQGRSSSEVAAHLRKLRELTGLDPDDEQDTRAATEILTCLDPSEKSDGAAGPGREYQELAALVAKTLDPDAVIRTGTWVEGPDGGREVDVEVRGTVDGAPHFVLIECKDWGKRRVDIQEIDKLDSKRRDLGADAVVICSNSGFSKKALRKAARTGIDAVSIVAAGNRRVRAVLEREVIAKRLSVDNFTMRVFATPECAGLITDGWDLKSLRYAGRPVWNWFASQSRELLRDHEGEAEINLSGALDPNAEFDLGGTPVHLRGFKARLRCSRTWVSQIVRENVTLGYYDHIKRKVTVPDKQTYTLEDIDRDGWTELEDQEQQPEPWTKPLQPGTFRLHLTIFQPIPEIEGESAPPLEDVLVSAASEGPPR